MPSLRAAALAAKMATQRAVVRDVEAEVEAEAAAAGAALPDEWLAALSEAMQPDPNDPLLPASLRASLLHCVEGLHASSRAEFETEFERVRSKFAFQREQLEKRMANQRRAGNAEAGNVESVTKILEAKHKEALAAMQAEVDGTRSACEAELEESRDAQSRLLEKLTKLDGGAEKARLEKQQYMRRLQQRAIRRARNARLAAGFTTWTGASRERRRMRNAARRLVRVGMARCFRSWVKAREERRRTQRLLAGAEARMKRPALAASLSHWKHDWQMLQAFTAEGGLLGRCRMLEAELKLLAEESEERIKQAELRVQARMRAEHTERLALFAAKRLRSVHLWVAWGHWAEMGCERRRLLSVLGRMRSARRAAAFAAWAEWRGEVAAARTKLWGAKRAGITALLCRGFGGWVSTADAWRGVRDTMAAVATRLARRLLASGFDSWREFAEECAEQRDLQRLAAERLRIGVARFGVSSFAPPGTPREGIASDSDAELQRAKDDLAAATATAEAQLAAALDAERLATEEAQRRGEAIARLEREIRRQVHERQVLCGDLAEIEANMRDELQRLGTELAHAAEEGERLKAALGEETRRADAASEAEQRMNDELRRAPMPLAEQERRALTKAMNARMQRLSDDVAAQHARRVRELTSVIALRDRQLAQRRPSTAGGASPRAAAHMQAMLGTSASASCLLPVNLKGSRSLDTRPLAGITVRGRTAPYPSMVTSGGGSGGGGGGRGGSGACSVRGAGMLACTPSLLEAEALAVPMIEADDVERSQLLRAGKMAEDTGGALVEHPERPLHVQRLAQRMADAEPPDHELLMPIRRPFTPPPNSPYSTRPPSACIK